MENNWILLREYASQLEADLNIGFLEDNDIPVRIEGPPVGVFGPGYTGATAVGVRLYVPASFAKEAAELLEDVEEPSA